MTDLERSTVAKIQNLDKRLPGISGNQVNDETRQADLQNQGKQCVGCCVHRVQVGWVVFDGHWHWIFFLFFSIFFFPTAGKEPDHPDYLPTDVIAYLKDVTEAVEGGTQTKPPKELTSRIPTNTEGDSSFYDVTKINATKDATSLVSD